MRPVDMLKFQLKHSYRVYGAKEDDQEKSSILTSIASM